MPVNKVKRRGSYAPLSAHYYKDDRLIRAGERAELLYVRALAFCADVLNDGVITDAQLAHVGVGMTSLKARAKALVDVEAWERVAGGYRVVAWLEWNKSREDILSDAKKDSDRKGTPAADQSFPPEPPPDGLADVDSFQPDNPPAPERIPNGIVPDAARSRNGFRPLAGGPARAPSNSRAELPPEPAPTELALVPSADLAVDTPQTINKRAQSLATTYRDKVGSLANFVAVMKIAKAALEDSWPDDAVETALLRLADDQRPVTKDSLRYELTGPPKARRGGKPSASDRANRTLANLSADEQGRVS